MMMLMCHSSRPTSKLSLACYGDGFSASEFCDELFRELGTRPLQQMRHVGMEIEAAKSNIHLLTSNKNPYMQTVKWMPWPASAAHPDH